MRLDVADAGIRQGTIVTAKLHVVAMINMPLPIASEGLILVEKLMKDLRVGSHGAFYALNMRAKASYNKDEEEQDQHRESAGLRKTSGEKPKSHSVYDVQE